MTTHASPYKMINLHGPSSHRRVKAGRAGRHSGGHTALLAAKATPCRASTCGPARNTPSKNTSARQRQQPDARAVCSGPCSPPPPRRTRPRQWSRPHPAAGARCVHVPLTTAAGARSRAPLTLRSHGHCVPLQGWRSWNSYTCQDSTNTTFTGGDIISDDAMRTAMHAVLDK